MRSAGSVGTNPLFLPPATTHGRSGPAKPTTKRPLLCSPIEIRAGCSDRQSLANDGWPSSQIEPVVCEECQSEPINTEGYASGVGGIAVLSPQVPSCSKVVAVTIKAHTSRWSLF